MVVEVIVALSLPVWLVVEEVLRLRALRRHEDPVAVQTAQPRRRPQEVALSRSA